MRYSFRRNRRSIREPLDDDAAQSIPSTILIVVAELILGKVAVQVRLTTVLIVAGRAMSRELLASVTIAAVFVGHHASFARHVGENDWHQGFGLHVLDNHRAGLAVDSVNESENLHLVMEGALLLDALELADEGFVNFDHATVAAELRQVAIAHRFADTVG